MDADQAVGITAESVIRLPGGIAKNRAPISRFPIDAFSQRSNHILAASTRLLFVTSELGDYLKAGGVFTDATGREFDYRGPYAQGEGSLAANAVLHAEALRRFGAP